MKKTIVILLCLLAVCNMYSLAGNVITVRGKVEMQEKNGAWTTLTEGMSIPVQSIISTGFKSEATIQIGASIVTIKALTRMTLQELNESAQGVATDLYVEVGTISADVKSLNGKPNDFKVRTPAATASVRGTSFTVSNGKVAVQQGSVALTTAAGQTRTGRQGDTIQQSASGAVIPPVVSASAKTLPAVSDASPAASEVRSSARTQAPSSQAISKVDTTAVQTAQVIVIITK